MLAPWFDQCRIKNEDVGTPVVERIENLTNIIILMNRLRIGFTLFVLAMASLSGCLGEEEDQVQSFPAFSAVADDTTTYDNARMSGSPYIVLFSAEWCNNPCYTSMHTIWEAVPELPVLVMSTDPVENISGVTLSDWHDSADAHDDEGDDTGVSLTTYAFMKGSEPAAELGIDTPGSVVFVNARGEVTDIHEGRLDSVDDVLAKWDVANA